MPVSEYFKGHGKKVMDSMTKQYGEKKGKQVFYATANKKGQSAKKKKSSMGHSNPDKMFGRK